MCDFFYQIPVAAAEFFCQDQETSLLLGTGLNFARSKCTNISMALLLFPPVNCHSRALAWTRLHAKKGQANPQVEQKPETYTGQLPMRYQTTRQEGTWMDLRCEVNE